MPHEINLPPCREGDDPDRRWQRKVGYVMIPINIAMDINMRTVQMTLDESLVAEVDRAAKRLKTTRSAFARDALRNALEALKIRELERKHREGYARKPVAEGEFDSWESEHAWGEGA